jgi:hypothetical protein
MDFAIVSLHTPNFQPLADLTWNRNKVLYAERRGYGYACKTDQFYGVGLGFEKIWFINDMMEAYPEIDWFWWTGCDTLVTNMTVGLETKADNNYHFVISTDCNGINADSFLIRNSPEGKYYIKMIMSKQPEYKDHGWMEQQVIIDTLEDNKALIKIVPQREINAYNYQLYQECAEPEKQLDKLGVDGNWKPGDLLIHWPGTSLPHRIHLAQHYMQQIVL